MTSLHSVPFGIIIDWGSELSQPAIVVCWLIALCLFIIWFLTARRHPRLRVDQSIERKAGILQVIGFSILFLGLFIYFAIPQSLGIHRSDGRLILTPILTAILAIRVAIARLRRIGKII